jgi:hypothetical protein
MIQRSQSIICICALMFVGARATAQIPPAEDFQQWTTVAAAWQVKPKLAISTFGEVHLGNDVSQFDQELASAGVIYPLSMFASGSERAEQENCVLIANQNVRGIWNNLRPTAHGCVLLWSNTHQVTKTEKAPSYQALSWRLFALCATSAFRLTTVRLQTSVGRAFALS